MSKFPGETISPAAWQLLKCAVWMSFELKQAPVTIEGRRERCLDCSIDCFDCLDWTESSLLSEMFPIDQRFNWQRRFDFPNLKTGRILRTTHFQRSIAPPKLERSIFQPHRHNLAHWMLRDFQCFVTNTAAHSFPRREAKSFWKTYLAVISAGTKVEIHFSLFQIIALFGCWNGQVTRELRGDFSLKLKL